MSGNTERFTGRVREYARYRREYPAEKILPWLRESCGLVPEWRVADVAAGTGMLTEVFLRNGNRVTAVEPNAEMREVCGGLRAEWPGLSVEEGTAESTGLPGAGLEMVAAGRAFHWFEPVAAAVEFRRVLVPRGWVVLVSSGRRRDDSARGEEFEAMLLEHGTDPEFAQRRSARMEGAVVFLRGMGDPRSYRSVEFEEERQVDLAELRGMVQSVSCTPLADDPRYPGMQRAIEDYFARWSEGGLLRWSEVCLLQVSRTG